MNTSSSASTTPAFLVSHGSFNPAHQHHIEMMVQARQCLNEAGYHVVRGVLAITSREYLKGKGVEAVTDDHRVAILDLAIRDATGESGWLGADGRGIHYCSAKRMIDRVLRNEFMREAPNATIFRVIGADCVARLGQKGHMTSGPAVIFHRTGSPMVHQFVKEGQQIFWVNELFGELSSTRLRNAIESKDVKEVAGMCCPCVVEYLFQNWDTLYGLPSKVQQEQRKQKDVRPRDCHGGKGNHKGKAKSRRFEGSGCLPLTMPSSNLDQASGLNQNSSLSHPPEPRQDGKASLLGRAILIGIAGPSGSGKSTLAAQVAEALGSPVLPISSDWYNGAIPIKEKKDWEKPESHDFEALIEDLMRVRHVLASSQNHPAVLHVGRPSQRRHRNIMAERKQLPGLQLPVIPIVVEGFVLFHNKTLCDMFDVRMWLEADCQECLQRRFNRRGKQGGLEEFTKFYKDIVWHHFLKYRDVQLSHAHDALSLNGHEGIDVIAKQAAAHCFALFSGTSAEETAISASNYEELGSGSITSQEPLNSSDRKTRRWKR